MDFSGATALVTGAGTGVGLAAVRRLLSAGCKVIATIETVDQAASLDGLGCDLVAVLDVTKADDWACVVENAERSLGGVDILFNNAGATIRGDLEETDRSLWEKTLLVNLTSVYLGCSAVIRGMLRKGAGAIVNNASINGLRGNAGLVAYSAAKSGVVGMTRSLALDYATKGIRINCICPAAIDTAMTRDYLAAAEDRDAVVQAIIAKHPIGRMASADEVAAVAVFLASKDAGFLTGLAIPVDGGRSIR